MADERKNIEDMSEDEIGAFLHDEWLQRGEEFAMDQARELKKFLNSKKAEKEQAEAEEGRNYYMKFWREFREKQQRTK